MTVSFHNPAAFFTQNPDIAPVRLGETNVVESFGKVLSKALGEVNSLQNQSDKMVQMMITHPDKVNIHDVTTLMSQAEMSLSMTKVVTDRVINAYREITNLR